MSELVGPEAAGWIREISVWVLPVLIAITAHEAAHGFVAWRLGDDTAYRLGRVTFNPLKHIDPFGTIILPALLLLSRSGLLFGWAKPVPVRFDRLRHPRRGMVLVAAAGPGINLVLAVISALLMHTIDLLPGAAAVWTDEMLRRSVALNVVLAVFNMLPIPPLDGGRVLAGLLPGALGRWFGSLERFGLVVLVLALLVVPLVAHQLGSGFSLFEWLLGGPIRLVTRAIMLMTGMFNR